MKKRKVITPETLRIQKEISAAYPARRSTKRRKRSDSRMLKTEVSNAIAEKAGVTSTTVKHVLSAAADVAAEAMRDEEVTEVRFGEFARLVKQVRPATPERKMWSNLLEKEVTVKARPQRVVMKLHMGTRLRRETQSDNGDSN